MLTTTKDNQTIWGLAPEALHDRLWSGRGVQVVRPGGAAGAPDARLFLLLEPGALVLFDLPRPARRRRAVTALCVVETGGDTHTERVIADDDGRLIAVRREYTPAVVAEAEVLVTRDPKLARAWREGATRRELRLASGPRGFRRVSCRGRIFDPADLHALVETLVSTNNNVEPRSRAVGQPATRVWAHETARIAPDARLVGPVWVGAGVHIEPGAVVVGPRVLADTVETATAPVSFAWHSRQVASRTPARPRVGRRVFDIAFSVASLALTAPLFPLIMAAIWLEDGRPLFFNHTRQTLGGRNFVCFKFRTMCRNAEQLKRRLVEQNVCDGPQFHVENDPRLLRVGRWLRRFHLDELPQFANVLAGQMSVIGPRPSPDDENQFCPAWREARLSVKPGLTGLWQVRRTRAPNTDFQEWIRHDLDYVDSQSWRLDMQIVFKTTRDIVGSVLPRRAA